MIMVLGPEKRSRTKNVESAKGALQQVAPTAPAESTQEEG
jgi:hypothetical protein